MNKTELDNATAPRSVDQQQACSACGESDGFWPADYVDNGVGMEKCSPAHCDACGWTEPSSEDIFADMMKPNDKLSHEEGGKEQL